MRPSAPRRPPKGFTLVELITAASLMTIMMVGVVEVFGIITQTAGEAEGIHFAQQQMRAFFDLLHNDLRAMTREGYLAIQKGTVTTDHDLHDLNVTPDYRYETGPVSNTASGTGGVDDPREYACDLLAFVRVGPCRSQMRNPPEEASCAEVVYTNNVETPERILQVHHTDGDRDLDPRRGILGRGLWLLDGDTGDEDDSTYTFLCRLFGATASPSPPTQTETLWVEPVLQGENIASWSDQQDINSLNRVMASCVSEFYVEVFDPGKTGSKTNYWPEVDKTYRWSTEFENADTIKTWPQAIRVTVAVHDPGDRARLPGDRNRYRGVVMQEVFWVGDP